MFRRRHRLLLTGHDSVTLWNGRQIIGVDFPSAGFYAVGLRVHERGTKVKVTGRLCLFAEIKRWALLILVKLLGNVLLLIVSREGGIYMVAGRSIRTPLGLYDKKHRISGKAVVVARATRQWYWAINYRLAQYIKSRELSMAPPSIQSHSFIRRQKRPLAEGTYYYYYSLSIKSLLYRCYSWPDLNLCH